MNFQSGMSSEKSGKTDMAEKTCLCISFFFFQEKKKTAKKFNGISALFMNFQSGMSSEKSGKTDMAEKTCLCISFHRDSAGSTAASGTSDCEDTFLFRVYIDEPASFLFSGKEENGQEVQWHFRAFYEFPVRNVLREVRKNGYGREDLSVYFFSQGFCRQHGGLRHIRL